MSPASRIDRILAGLHGVALDVEALKAEVPAYAVDSTRFVSAELKVLGRRFENMQKVVGTRPAA